MNIAIVTGASSGIGREFVRQIAFRESSIDAIWVIARRRERLEMLAKRLPIPVKVLAYDLTNTESLTSLRYILHAEKPRVRIVVNAAGFGKFGSYKDIAIQDQVDMMRLNMEALVRLTQTVLPFMPRGARIINMASMAAFQPLPYFGLYAATKAFVLSYSRALHEELKERCVAVTAVCPGFVNTEFIGVAQRSQQPTACTHYKPLYEARDVVRRALADSRHRRDISVYGLNTNMKRCLAKITPNPIIMAAWQWLRKH